MFRPVRLPSRLPFNITRMNVYLLVGLGFLTSRFHDHTRRRITVGRTPLDEWSARRRNPYLTTHNRQTSMPPTGFEPAVPTSEMSQIRLRPRGHRDRLWLNCSIKLGYAVKIYEMLLVWCFNCECLHVFSGKTIFGWFHTFVSFRRPWISLQTKRNCLSNTTTRRNGTLSVIRWVLCIIFGQVRSFYRVWINT